MGKLECTRQIAHIYTFFGVGFWQNSAEHWFHAFSTRELLVERPIDSSPELRPADPHQRRLGFRRRGERAQVSKDEMMHLMWPHASTEDMDHMCTVFDHCRLVGRTLAKAEERVRSRIGA